MKVLEGAGPSLERVSLSPVQYIAERLDTRCVHVRDQANIREVGKVREEPGGG